MKPKKATKRRRRKPYYRLAELIFDGLPEKPNYLVDLILKSLPFELMTWPLLFDLLGGVMNLYDHAGNLKSLDDILGPADPLRPDPEGMRHRFIEVFRKRRANDQRYPLAARVEFARIADLWEATLPKQSEVK